MNPQFTAPPACSATKPPTSRADRSLVIQCACTALVATGAAYASYRHGREFAHRFGADPVTSAIWPLIVDGLLTMATVELWRPGRRSGSRAPAWLAFSLGICLSLCANIAAAPNLTGFAVAVAACPPLALLLSVELLNTALKRHRARGGRIAAGSLLASRCRQPDSPDPDLRQRSTWLFGHGFGGPENDVGAGVHTRVHKSVCAASLSRIWQTSCHGSCR